MTSKNFKKKIHLDNIIYIIITSFDNVVIVVIFIIL